MLPLQWLDECIRLNKQQQQDTANGAQQDQQQGDESAAAAAGPSSPVSSALFAPVVGGASEAERVRSAKAAAERDVAGKL